MVNNIWLAILLMAGVTYLIRVLPLVLLRYIVTCERGWLYITFHIYFLIKKRYKSGRNA